MFGIKCVVCREDCDHMTTCYQEYENGEKVSMEICWKCFQETKNNWFKEPWKICMKGEKPNNVLSLSK